MSRPLRRAQRSGRISPRGRKRLWVTEVSWDSSPPDPRGVPAARHARWSGERAGGGAPWCACACAGTR